MGKLIDEIEKTEFSETENENSTTMDDRKASYENQEKDLNKSKEDNEDSQSFQDSHRYTACLTKYKLHNA